MSETNEIDQQDPSMNMEWKSEETLAAEAAAKAAAEANAGTQAESATEAEPDNEIIGEDGLTDYERGLYEQFEEKNPKVNIELRDHAKELAEVEGQLDAFEATHPLDDLFAVEDLTQEEAPKHPIRNNAKNHLDVIFPALCRLRDETDVPTDKYQQLFQRYDHFSKAVGVIKNGKVDHGRAGSSDYRHP